MPSDKGSRCDPGELGGDNSGETSFGGLKIKLESIGMLIINVSENIRVGISENPLLHKSNKNSGRDCHKNFSELWKLTRGLEKPGEYSFKKNS